MAFLPQERLARLLGLLSDLMDVVAPILIEGVPVFASWSGQPLALKDNPLQPPQEFFLPQREVLFRYIQDSGSYSFEEAAGKPRLIFGIRPCDLRALTVLDRIFGSDPVDQFYFDKRRSTVLVALNCTQPGLDCFCDRLGFGPECSEPPDLQLTEMDKGYLVQTGSPAGILILREHPEFFLEASKSHLQEIGKLLARAREAMKSRSGRSLPDIKEAIKKADWSALGRVCLNCGSCTFVCPVCHCFTIQDLGIPDGERMRCRDTCLLSGFSRMAGGANPRSSQGDRMQNWYQDKFEYIPQRTGLLGCVGCGRCSRVCLAEMDRWSLEVKR
ncbi:Sulfhydrogenase 2 subunit beta [uncultured archaeon]|nr:Sulfhydrogenase 2 subunit beta [uncultured archaeon]